MHFTLESVEHALMISSATTKFAGFLKLPETSSYINVYLDAAFTAVAAVFPAVRLLKLLDGISKEATVALAVAKAAGSSAPVAAAVVHAPKAGEIADESQRYANEGAGRSKERSGRRGRWRSAETRQQQGGDQVLC